MANHGMSLVEYDLDQSPPPDECLLGDANYIPAHLVFSPDEPVFDPEARMRLWMVTAVCIIQGMRLFILKKNKCLVNSISPSILHGMI